TAQVPFRTKIATAIRKNSIDRDLVKVDFVKSYIEVTEDNYQVLGLLDALKDIKDIPDTTVSNSIVIPSSVFKKLPKREIINLIESSLSYPPRVRGLLGAMLEDLGVSDQILQTLKESLNPFTKITLGVSENSLSTAKNWNIQ